MHVKQAGYYWECLTGNSQGTESLLEQVREKPKVIFVIIIHVAPFVPMASEAWGNLGYIVNVVKYDEYYNRA